MSSPTVDAWSWVPNLTHVNAALFASVQLIKKVGQWPTPESHSLSIKAIQECNWCVYIVSKRNSASLLSVAAFIAERAKSERKRPDDPDSMPWLRIE